MKQVMILSGGTATAWHIAKVLKQYYSNCASLIVCDINPPQMVHTSILADRFFTVPPIRSPGYYEFMLSLMEQEKTDILVPLIDDDIQLFPRDNPDLAGKGIYSTAPFREIVLSLGNKEMLGEALHRIDVTTPQNFKVPSELCPDRLYFLKDTVGCGSKGVQTVSGRDISAMQFLEGKIIQEICRKPEITVDVVQDGGKVFTICRERIEIKLGVSTKCRLYYDPEIQGIMERIAAQVELPEVCCVQFMKNSEDKWCLIDFNLRSGGGTAMSAQAGFEAVRYAAAQWLGQPANEAWLHVPEKERYVVRAYREIITA